MSEKLKGTNLSSPIVPFTEDDIFPTHFAKYGNGGYMSIQTLDELYALPQLRREEGMLAYCIEDKKIYQLEDNEWVLLQIGGINPELVGLPIYDEDKIEELEQKGILPDDYISIPSEPELENPHVSNSYLKIIFSSLRALQAEVAKMKNTFQYGMYSYTNRETAMSSVVNGYSEEEDTEPLWSVDESDCSLSIVTNATLQINDNHTLEPRENVESAEGILTINSNGAAWYDEGDGFEACPDTKLYLYLTTSDTDIKITLTNCDSESDTIIIDFNNLNIVKSLSEKYNIMLCVSRAVVNDEDTGIYVGKNYAWISVANFGTGETTNSGFWKNDELYPNTVIIGDSEHLSDYRYYISSVEFKNENLYKFNGYSQYQNFSEGVGTEIPDDTDYKYRVAHITIRSVENLDMLNSIKNQLPTNELIYNEANGTLWIKLSNGNVRQISGSGTNTDSGMEQSEIIEWLAQNGIYVTESGSENIRIDNLGEITFIHQATGKSFRFTIDSEGNLVSTEIPSLTLQDRMNRVNFSLRTENTPVNSRGFVGSLGYAELHAQTPSITESEDIKLYADRVKIGAIYAPYSPEQTVFGCSHGYIELENTSDKDFQLDGCYLHFATGICTSVQDSGTDTVSIYTLPLKGILPGGGTFLVRCKKYTDYNQANTFIDVNSFDMEWYSNGKLLDLTLSQNNTFMLTYGVPENFSISTPMTSVDSTPADTKFSWRYNPRYIDSVSIGAHVTSNTRQMWTNVEMKCFVKGAVQNNPIDCIYKNTFQLDPAKQAYQSLTGADSSRKRNENVQDYQYVLLNNENIEFPKTIDTIPVSAYTPKASYLHKNVSTDKTKLNKEKPNMVTCSFGINMHTTRCFNWISCGVFDEYIWIRHKNQESWEARFESYKVGTENDITGSSGFEKKKFGKFHNKTSGNVERIQDVVYSRIIGVFPGDGTQYTAHKCIVQLRQSAPSDKEEYEYVVGRADKNGNPDTEHISEIQTFTLCPSSYSPVIFQITDQQGFTWIEYQVWAAAAKKVNDEITAEEANHNIIPVLINTGDMTQNGTRINEWYDYYEGGRELFSHLEQMNVVGNNDLCGPDPEVLGTGDDAGKSNAFYFHVFYCYEIPEIEFESTAQQTDATETDAIPSIEDAVVGDVYNVNGTYYVANCNLPIISNTNATKYVPSLYYFENTGTVGVDSYRFVMVNSEITKTTCEEWYKQYDSSGNSVNVYTGWPISNKSTDTYDNSFTTVYTMIYDFFNGTSQNQHAIAVMHEMPFTVITNSNLKIGTENVDRSLNGTNEGALVGSHTNRLGKQDTHALYWFSRLLEHFEVKLCIGGHKHTYACTNRLREFYLYEDNGVSKNSLQDGKMTMERTLENDTAKWTATLYYNSEGRYQLDPITNAETKIVNTTKFPIMLNDDDGSLFSIGEFYPYYGDSTSGDEGVTYFMCQATGYKLKSNKELPSNSQLFSYVIPKTIIQPGKADKPSENQLDPMFSTIILNQNTYQIFLRKIMNIFKISSGTHLLFSQLAYSNEPMVYKYLVHEEDMSETNPNIIYGKWVDEKQSLILV